MSANVRVENLSVTLPNGRRILRRASLEVAAGEVVVILGPSGSGKSTLGDVIFGLMAERAPGVEVEVETIEGDESRMALVLQRGSLFDHLDVAGNIRFAARRRRGIALDDEAVAGLLHEVGLDNADQSVDALSGGEERRVTVARALATEPGFIFFDEPGAGLDVANVRRLGALIRRICTEHDAGAIVVTHNPLLAALTGDRVLYLDSRDGTIIPLLGAWEGPASAYDEYAVTKLREAIEEELMDRLEAETKAGVGQRRAQPKDGTLARFARKPVSFLLAPGRLLADLTTVLVQLPRSLRHPGDFGQIGWRALFLTGYSGLPFYALVAAIFSATFLSIAFAAAALVSPELVLENLRGDFILAMTPALCGFLFSARSGSALSAWLGGLALRRQTDALRSLGVSVDQYLRVPAFLGTFAAFLLTTVVFGAAMYLAAVATAAGYGLADAAETLRQTSPSFERQLFQKTLLYGVFTGLIGTHMGLLPKRSSDDVARGITRSIIASTLAIVLSELFFAFRL